MSQLLKSFLDPHSIEFSSSIFNEITNLSKIVKGVPYKLRLERGQSLDTFLLDLLQTVRAPKSKPMKNPTSTTSGSFDIIETKLNNPMFVSCENTKTADSPSSSNTNKKVRKTSVSNSTFAFKKKPNYSQTFTTPFESFICLITCIYKLPKHICLIIFSLRKLIQNSFDYLVDWTVSKKIQKIKSPEAIESLINLFQELIFEYDENDPDKNLPSEILYEKAFESINDFIWKDFNLNILVKNSIVSKEKLAPGVEEGTRLFLESFQYPIWNKNLSYMLLDCLLEELFPELDSI